MTFSMNGIAKIVEVMASLINRTHYRNPFPLDNDSGILIFICDERS